MRFASTWILLATAACSPAWHADFDRLRGDLEPLIVRHATVPPGPSTDAALDQALAGRVDVEQLVTIALARNPSVREAAARANAMVAEVYRAGALDEPMLTMKVDELRIRPDGPAGDRKNVLALEQRFPAPGSLGLRAESAFRQAEAMFQMYREREREVVARVKKAYIEYASMTRHLEIHREHITILEEFEKISDAKFRTGAVSQQDVLKPQVELVMLNNEIIQDEQRIESARTMLNELLNRPADAPLGRPSELDPKEETFDLVALQTDALNARPELVAAALRVKGAAAGLNAADREATWPEFSAGVEYMQMPGEPDSWGAMLGVSLPWFTGKRSAEVRRQRGELRAEELALEGLRSRVQAEVRDAWLRVESARKSVALFKSELLPKSRQSVEVSRASYEKEKATFLDLLDAERSLRDVRVEYTRALADFASAAADLERAVGTDLRRKP